MPEIQHASTFEVSGPWLLSAAALNSLDALSQEQAQRLRAARDEAISMRLRKLASKSGEKTDEVRRHVERSEPEITMETRLSLGAERTLVSNSLAELESDPQLEYE